MRPAHKDSGQLLHGDCINMSKEITQAIVNALRDGTPVPQHLREQISSASFDGEGEHGGPFVVVLSLRGGSEFTITVTHTQDGHAWK